MNRFGIGHLTGIDLAGEAAGRLKVPGDGDWYPVDLATNAFGQGISVTPMQMMTAASAIANDGRMVTPHVLYAMVRDGRQYNVPATICRLAHHAPTPPTPSPRCWPSRSRRNRPTHWCPDIESPARPAPRRSQADYGYYESGADQRLLHRLGTGGRSAVHDLRLARKALRLHLGFRDRRAGLLTGRTEDGHSARTSRPTPFGSKSLSHRC